MSAVATEILLILLLILINGLFALSEMAVVSARKARLQHLAEEGDSGAKAALALAIEPTRFLSTVQIGITLVGILAGAFGGATLAENIAAALSRFPAMARYGEAIGLVIVVLAITYLSLVLGELVPKRLALNNPEHIAALIAGPMRAVSAVANPAVRLLSASTELVLRLLRMRPSAEPPITEEEINILLAQGARVGVFEAVEQELVASVFRLGERRAEGLITPRTEIVWLDMNDSRENIQGEIFNSRHTRFPIARGSLDEVVGVVRGRDVLAGALQGRPMDLQAVAESPLFIPASTRAYRVLTLLKESGRHMGFVLDEYGGLQGIVTLHNLMEALVGQLPTHGDARADRAVRRADGSWLVDGMMPIGEFKELFGIEHLPDEERAGYQTLGGFAMSQLGTVPDLSEQFAWSGLQFEIVDMDGRRVDKLLVTPVAPRS